MYTPERSDWLEIRTHRVHVQEALGVIELEHYGVPFSRTEDGRIYQRPFAA